MTAEEWIATLGLQVHPEGGFYKETYRSQETVGNRNLATSIYFLLRHFEVSHFHRIKSDEIWYHHYGNTFHIHLLHKTGAYEIVKLGNHPNEGEVLQYIVPAGTIFGSSVAGESGFGIVGCMVAPGFDFEDFKLFSKEELLSQFPQHKEIINRLTIH